MKAFLRRLWRRQQHEPEVAVLPLREFVYFDRQKVEDFVSALMAGLPSETREVTTETPSEITGSIGYSATKLGFRKGRQQLTREELLGATDASLFEQLHQIMERKRIIVSENNPAPLEGNSFIETRTNIEFSAYERLFSLIKWVKDLGAISRSDLSDRGAKRRDADYVAKFIDELGGERETCNVRITPLAQPFRENVFVASLPKTNIRGAKEALAGEYIFFGRVARKLAEGERFPVFRIFPQSVYLPEEGIAKLLKDAEDVAEILGSPVVKEDLEISHSAIILTPIAIFR